MHIGEVIYEAAEDEINQRVYPEYFDLQFGEHVDDFREMYDEAVDEVATEMIEAGESAAKRIADELNRKFAELADGEE